MRIPAPQDPQSLSLKSSRGGAPSGKRPDFSGVRGSASTRPAQGAAAASGSAADRSYTVRKGDTLSHIAKAHYGKASDWQRIFEANRDQLDDPDLIHPGQVLRIP
jgi:nucleoid-associated protein YgaU